MALNWTRLDDSKGFVPLENERTVMAINKGAEVVLTIPEEGGSPKKLKETGGIWVTDQRLVFVGPSEVFESLSIPLGSLLSTSFLQPTFSANYLAIEIKPSPGGGLTEGAKAEIRLKEQGLYSFVSALEKVRERALFMKRESAMEDELPVYSSPSTFAAGRGPQLASTSTSTSNQPTDAPPGYDTV